MKKIKFIVMLSLAVILLACGSDESTTKASGTTITENSNSLIGIWVLDEVKLGGLDNLPESQQNMMESMMESMKGKMKFIFNNDGTTSVETSMMGVSDTKEGKYHIDGDKIIITETDNGEQAMSFSIEEGKLHLSHTQEGQEISMVLIRE